jgi:hypothetical protein
MRSGKYRMIEEVILILPTNVTENLFGRSRKTKDRQYKGQQKRDKQQPTKHYTEN